MKRIITFLLAISCVLPMVKADNCGNRCTSSQLCMKDGTCHERSDLILCPSFTTLYERTYCRKGQECCGTGCMPEGKVCCQTSYCDNDHTCCSIIGCCPTGTFCSGFRCLDDKYSTRIPTTPTPRPTSKPRTASTSTTTKLRTTTMSITRYPIRTYPPSTTPSTHSSTYFRSRYSSERTTKGVKNTLGESSASDSESAFKPWHYAIIVIGVMFVIFVSALLIRSHYIQKNTSKARAQSGERGMAIKAPNQINGHTNINRGNNGKGFGVPTQTEGPPKQLNVAYFITKSGLPSSASGQQQNKRIVFVITKPNISEEKSTK